MAWQNIPYWNVLTWNFFISKLRKLKERWLSLILYLYRQVPLLVAVDANKRAHTLFQKHTHTDTHSLTHTHTHTQPLLAFTDTVDTCYVVVTTTNVPCAAEELAGCPHIDKYTHTHSYTHIHTHTYTHRHTHTYMHPQTHISTNILWNWRTEEWEL